MARRTLERVRGTFESVRPSLPKAGRDLAHGRLRDGDPSCFQFSSIPPFHSCGGVVAQTNLGGLAGAAIGGLAGYGIALALGKAGQPPVDSFAWGAAAGCSRRRCSACCTTARSFPNFENRTR